MEEKGSEIFLLEVTEIELRGTYETSTFTGVDSDGVEYTLSFLPGTRVRLRRPEKVTREMVEILRQGVFPFKVGDEVLVYWKPYSPPRSRIAVKLALF